MAWVLIKLNKFLQSQKALLLQSHDRLNVVSVFSWHHTVMMHISLQTAQKSHNYLVLTKHTKVQTVDIFFLQLLQTGLRKSTFDKWWGLLASQSVWADGVDRPAYNPPMQCGNM